MLQKYRRLIKINHIKIVPEQRLHVVNGSITVIHGIFLKCESSV
jgi:hypothetical protein